MPCLQKAWTASIENPTKRDIHEAIAEIQQMDDEHDAFWFQTDEEDIVLEVQKNLIMTFVLCGEICRESKCANWEQVEELYVLLVKGEYDKVKDKFECL